MKNIYFLLSICLLIATGQLSAQNDTLYVYKGGIVINKQSIKTVDVDSITFYKPTPIVPITATVNIGSLVWTTKNLDVTTYTDGTVIPQVTDPTAWAALKTGAWCYYNNDAANGTTYGKLYNWYAVAGIHDTDPATPNKKLAPTGYHIPTDAEWTTLSTFLGGASVAGNKMKATTGWTPYSGITNTNSSGFTGLPGGYRYITNGIFLYVGNNGLWWSISEFDTAVVWYSTLSANTSEAFRSYSVKELGLSVRCVRDNEVVVAVAPTLITTTATAITTIAATTGGNVTADGGAAVTARGVVWSTATNPTIALATKTANGTGTGIFTSSLTGLVANTTYYVRAYATNSAGTSYGNEISFTTTAIIIAQPSVTIGTQTWTTQNLNVTTYRDGTVIPQVTDPTAWANLTTGAWCYYANNTANATTYGKLYNWYAVAGIHDTDPNTPNKILAPTGYHIPTNDDWNTLKLFLGGYSVAGGKMKATGTALWASPNTAATNSSGFTGLPGGYRYSGTGTSLGLVGNWWSADELGVSGYAFPLSWDSSSADFSFYDKVVGVSVRCLRD